MFQMHYLLFPVNYFYVLLEFANPVAWQRKNTNIRVAAMVPVGPFKVLYLALNVYIYSNLFGRHEEHNCSILILRYLS